MRKGYQDSVSKQTITTSVKDYLFNDPKKEWCIEGYTVPITRKHKVIGTIDKDEKPRYLKVFDQPNDELSKIFL